MLCELKPYHRTLERFLRCNSGHPALTLVYAHIDRTLETASHFTPPRKVTSADGQARLLIELGRLHQAGITGADVFKRAATVWLFSHYQQRTLPPLSRELWFAIGYHVIHLGDVMGRRRGNRVPTGRRASFARERLGNDLLRLIHPVMCKVVEAIAAQANADRERRETLAAVLDTQPFA